MTDMQIVIFELLNELCGVETAQVREIVKYQEITKVPEMPGFIEGIINLRGHVIPVINLNARFHLGQVKASNSTKIIITNIDDQQFGFVVDDVLEIIRLSSEDTEETPQLIKKWGKKYVKCVAKIKDKLVNILDLGSIMTEEELEHINSL
jgi:purine-binding chemotaxis protein CheW